jgi:hypothetical protein
MTVGDIQKVLICHVTVVEVDPHYTESATLYDGPYHLIPHALYGRKVFAVGSDTCEPSHTNVKGTTTKVRVHQYIDPARKEQPPNVPDKE